ncbi:mevalonate kinase-like isoform X2 [Pogonomyrmex barbatus]|uniref:Mevalonate kinase-like isoform X2 n=1 Tax=Pogonomyrmex barbatus TaxID=144034 RepID=A0A6I9WSA7_9HYME|nr:mevalonate kinase-like isoform X2 [Pogonomyrmex barbatus]XP_025074966.1 mevalonate kinase-like isoform X2 [Pogonomyrmex barbatus]XP_025074967.1 mevalonate kinase-like isoform X2 [Pogonomyrmex barbatus]
MYEFKVSAPGIVFLYGGPKLEIIEYNKSCLAAGLDIRTKLEFIQGSSPSSGVESNETIRIKFKNLKLYLEIPLEAIYKCFYDQNGVREFSCENLMNTIEEFIKSLNIPDNTYDPTNEVQNSFLKSFLYLLLHMAYEENIKITASVIMKLSTDLPIAKGLGTTTSFIVCLAACFWRWSLLQKGIARNTFDSQDCIKIRRYVWRCEKIVYNFKNMINNFISVYGVMVMYKDEIDKFTLHKIEPIRILIVDSNIKEIKIDQLKEMKNLSQYADPIITRAALDKSFEAIEQIFQEFRKENRKRNDTNLADPLGLKSYHIKTILLTKKI